MECQACVLISLFIIFFAGFVGFVGFGLTALMASLENFPCIDECFLEGMSTAELNDIRTCGGAVCVTGRAGSVAGGAVVTATNTNTGDSRMVTAAADGSWWASLIGDSGDAITFAADDGTSGNVTVP